MPTLSFAINPEAFNPGGPLEKFAANKTKVRISVGTARTEADRNPNIGIAGKKMPFEISIGLSPAFTYDVNNYLLLTTDVHMDIASLAQKGMIRVLLDGDEVPADQLLTGTLTGVAFNPLFGSSDSVEVSDAVSASGGSVVMVLDHDGQAEILDRLLGIEMRKGLSDAAIASDDLSLDIYKRHADTAVVTDAASALKTQYHNASDAVLTPDQLETLVASIRPFNDAVGLADAVFVNFG